MFDQPELQKETSVVQNKNAHRRSKKTISGMAGHTVAEVETYETREPSTDCHPELAAKDLCQADKAGSSEIFPESLS
jgi:hypothetical protein